MEANSSNAISRLNARHFSHSILDLIFEDIFQMASHFGHISYSFTHREGNSVAHCLAKGVLTSKSNFIMQGSIPHYAFVATVNDSSSLIS